MDSLMAAVELTWQKIPKTLLSISSAHAFLLVYSVTDTNSFTTVKQRFEEIREERSDYQDLPIVVLANKTDMVEEVDPEDVKHWIHSTMPQNRSRFMECSALENINIKQVFKTFLMLSKIEFAPKCGFGGIRRNLSVKIKGSRSKSPSYLGSGDDVFSHRSKSKSPTLQYPISPRSRQGSSDSPSITPATTPRSDRTFFGINLGSTFGSPKITNGCSSIYPTNSRDETQKLGRSGNTFDEDKMLPLRSSKRSRSLIRRSSKKVKEQMNNITNVDECSIS
nr:ras-like protein 2 [Lepeophtheirus salmonis]